MLLQRKEFLQFLRDITTQNKTLLIFDEVISGFRVGPQGMAGLWGIRPDLLAYGKVLGGGFNVGCYGGRRDLMDLVAPNGPVYQAGTLSANPVGMRAGLETLNQIEKLDVYSHLSKTARGFAQDLQKIFDRFSGNFVIDQFESLFWIHARTEKPIRHLDQIPAGHKEQFARLFHELLKENIYLAPSGYEVGFLSYAHDQKVLQKTLEGFEKALKRMFA